MNTNNWYNKYLKIAYNHISQVRASDYYKFHKNFLLGIQDMDLLNKMIYDLRPAVKYVLQNSYLRHFPDQGKFCEECNPDHDAFESVMEWYDENENKDFENEGCLSKEEYDEIIKKNPEGFWKCCNCGIVEGWSETLEKTKDEKGKWRYTDSYEFLAKRMSQAVNEKSFGDKHAAFESIVEFAHMSGPQSNWFIEGGQDTIDRVRNMA